MVYGKEINKKNGLDRWLMEEREKGKGGEGR